VAGSTGLLLSIFAADILPVFLVAAVGFLLARYSHADVRALSRASLYGLSPCLIFDAMVTSTMRGEAFGRMALLCIIVTMTMGALARLVAIPLRLEKAALVPFMLVVMFSNGGNYGLPVTLFAFGREALSFATVYFLTSAVLTYTVGVSLAASGLQTRRQIVRGVARVPAVYAAIAAGLVLSFGLTVPAPIMTAVKLMSDAALPVMILVLGMQLERARSPRRPAVVALAAALSLLVAPAVAFGAVRLLGLSGPALHAGIIQASMPTAVVTTVLALEFELEPDFVTSVVVVTTAISPFTLTLLIAYLQRG
jgi:predicted permease